MIYWEKQEVTDLELIEFIKAIIYGIVEGITEWLPVSSTGHLILLSDFLPMKVSEDFWNVFLVVIQLGAILAVVVYFWQKIWPFNTRVKNKPFLRYDVLNLWCKIIVACLPAAIVGVLLDDWVDAHLYNSTVVAIMLIVVGIAFLIVERSEYVRYPRVTRLRELTYKDALIIGIFQVIAAVLPGTSRSGATIIGGLLNGVDRTTSAEFTFFLAIPVMAGASLLKIIKSDLEFTGGEMIILAIGVIVSFGVSLACIRFLMNYVKKHDFKVFGLYRIVLGLIVLAYFTFLK